MLLHAYFIFKVTLLVVKYQIDLSLSTSKNIWSYISSEYFNINEKLKHFYGYRILGIISLIYNFCFLG